MLDLDKTTITINKTLSIRDYINSEYSDCDYVSFVLHDNSVLDIDINTGNTEEYENVEELFSELEIDGDYSDFKIVTDDLISPYFKLYLKQ